MSQTFMILYRPGPGWLPGKPQAEQPLQEHGKYILQLHVAGKLRFAGPFEDNSGGAAVIEVENEVEARDIVNSDPAVTSQVFEYDLHPFRLIPWEQYAKRSPQAS
jgi:uncharacterized protein YciI